MTNEQCPCNGLCHECDDSPCDACCEAVDERRERAGRLVSPLTESDEARFRSRVGLPDSRTGCMAWLGGATHKGYGTFSLQGRNHYTHRIAWFLAEGHAPYGLVTDHLCRNTRCVNPLHLELVTPRENTVRGNAGLHRVLTQNAKTHCANGHERNEQNTRIRPDGARACRPCQNERLRRRRAAK